MEDCILTGACTGYYLIGWFDIYSNNVCKLTSVYLLSKLFVCTLMYNKLILSFLFAFVTLSLIGYLLLKLLIIDLVELK